MADQPRHDLVDRQGHAVFAESAGIDETECFGLLFFRIDLQFAFVEIERFLPQRHFDGFEGLHPVIDANDLVFGVESGHLEEIRGIQVISDFHVKVHLFFELPFQALPGAFAEFESAAGEFGVIPSPDELVADQHLLVFA